jgi:predicted TIM-barrel fold metal-dependent hydrolase
LQETRYGKGDYPVNLDFLIKGDDFVHPRGETRWRHDPRSRSLDFVISEKKRRAPRVFSFYDCRQPEGAVKIDQAPALSIITAVRIDAEQPPMTHLHLKTATARGFALVLAVAASAFSPTAYLLADPRTDRAAPVETTEGSRFFTDAHVHFASRAPGDLDRVAEWMESMNVQRVINHPLAQSLPRDEKEREQMLANYAKYKGRIERFCIIFPNDVQTVEEAVTILTREKKEGAIGFGEHYGPGLMLDDPKNMRLYEACEKVGLPVMFHMDQNKNLDEKGLPHLENVLKAYPKCVLIAHSDWWRHISDGSCARLLENYPNLYADISCTVKRAPIGKNKEMAREFFIKHADKLLFGTDSGWWSFGKEPMPEFALIGALNLPKEVEDKICRENMEKLFPPGNNPSR